MQLALRPYVTTGIALVGASVIAMSPISPVTPDIHVPTISTSSVAVQLTGAINPTGDPFSAWLHTAVNAVEGAVGIGGQVLGNGAPVLTQVLANQMGYLNKIPTALNNMVVGYRGFFESTLPFYWGYAGEMLKAGQIGEAFNYAVTYPLSSALMGLFPLLDLMEIPALISRNITNVLEFMPSAVMGLGSGAMAATFAPFSAFAVQLQAIADSVNAGDPLGAVNAVLNIPAAMTSAFFSTVLAPYGGGLFGGLLGTLLVGIPDFLAQAIKPPAPPVAPAAVESVPDTLAADISSISSSAISAIGGAGTVTLSPATETPATETPVAETPVDETSVEETPVDETPVEETPVEETPVEETPVVDAEPVVETEATTLVRDSVQAKPGQLGLTKASQAGADLAKSARDEIAKVAKKIDEGIKKAFGKPAKKAAAESNAGSSNTGADSGTGSNE